MTEESSTKAGGLVSLVLIAALLAGISYYLASRMMEPSALLTVWKGTGVGLLAVWAAMQARSFDGALLALVMALGATGDVVLETTGTVEGGMAFMAGHVIAITLYFRNRRLQTSFSQKLLAILLVPIVIWLSWSLPADRSSAAGIALYAAPLALMAALAWTSRFSRFTVGIGAIFFVISDLFIFARMGPLASSMLPGLLIWPLYFSGQAMIAMGVVRTLATDTQA
ncbi:lysoplasmalogenase family protein [Parasphingopyxis lamellibrachiae]|uniref:Putative membrane protein YhhN n=1 Tax=Parasphingopyxis lamellibrachiae TaxID=680125 RepID=A0A3D9FER5_9SPHN|nr:lysoplasmalogenase family protein [Parasphingopyxis lamellibrachiae]RED15551.1 putative membrane protein YhhN [Parasphingopyxis lamellibrachiae]